MGLITRPAADQAVADLAAAVESLSTRVTELAGLTRGLSLNDVLTSTTVILDADGRAQLQTSVPYASVGIIALGDAVTASSGSNEDTPPTAGIGVLPIPGSGAIVWPLTGTSLSLYGTAGDAVIVSLWRKPQCPMFVAGYANVSGGSA